MICGNLKIKMHLENNFFQKIQWVFKRLSVISINELLFRLRERIDILLMYFQFKCVNDNSKTREYSFIESSKKVLPSYKWLAISNSNKLKLLEGKIPMFGSEWYWSKPDSSKSWRTAPENNNIWPDYFFDRVEFRQGNSVGDIRIAWESSRLQHLIALALIATSDKNGEKKNQAKKIYCDDILSWKDQNPKFSGIHYISSMECALRIISLSISFDIIRNHLDSNKKNIGKAVSAIITEHASFIIRRMSLHSSAGNHVLAESIGLIIAGLIFSEHPSSKNWFSFGLKVFESEIDRQIDKSGFGIEGASKYLIQIIEYSILCSSILKKFKIDVPLKISAALSRGLQQVNMLYNILNVYPEVGDSDSGFAVSFLFNEVFNKIYTSSTFIQNSHLLAIGDPKHPLSLVFCNGSLGMPPTYGHGHAHALSIQLYNNGFPILSDPGTYSYTGKPKWREHFRSTKVHNTLNINGKDQSQQELLFMWSKPYNCTNILFKKYKNFYICVSQHDGYSDLGITHKRMFIFGPSQGLYVKDWLISATKYTAELCWNINKPVINKKIIISKSSSLNFEIMNSSSNSSESSNFHIKNGWHSPRYNKKYKIKRITSLIDSESEASYESLFTLSEVDTRWYDEPLKFALKQIKTN